MIIVRHWAGKRLNRLWELVEQERLEAESDPTNQLIDSHYSSLNKAQTTRPTKLPVPSFGDSDRELGSMERTPRDMVQFSDRVLDQLLSAWVHEAGQSNPSSPDSKTQHRKVHFSSDSSESDNLDFESHAIHGHYLEGPTTDWRKPHSQAARYHAARQRAKYAGYQAHVESDSEGSEPRSRRESPNTDDDILFSDEDPKRRSSRSKPNPAMSTAHPTRNSPRSFDPNTSQALNQPNPQHLHPISRPQPIPSSHPRQQPYQQQQQQQQQQNHTLSHSMPVKIPPRASPSSQHPSHLQPPSHIEPYRHPSQRFSPQSPTRTQYQHSPARSYSSDTNRSHQRLPSRQKPARDSAKDRHKSLTDGATKGLIGAGAIAGFMDALEAFSAL